MFNIKKYPGCFIKFESKRIYTALEYPDVDLPCERRKSINLGQALIDFIDFDFKSLNEIVYPKIQKRNFTSSARLDLKLMNAANNIPKDNHVLSLFFSNTVNRILYVDDLTGVNLPHCIEYIQSVIRLQHIYKFIVELFLSVDAKENELSSTPKYKKAMEFFPELLNGRIKKSFAVFNGEANFSEIYITESLEGMLYFELMEMLHSGLRLKHCKLCGKFFILPNNRRYEFCDRIYKNNKTCKQLGAKTVFDKALSKDEVLRLYRREYNKIYSRMYRADGKDEGEFKGKDISREDFELWVLRCKKARKDYVEGRITGEEMMSRIIGE